MNSSYNFIAMGVLLNGADQLTAHEFKIMAMIIKRMNADGSCWPSRSLMASDAGISINALDKTLRSLKDKKWLESEPRYKEDGSQTSSLWRIPHHTLQHMGVPPSGQRPHPPQVGNKVDTLEVYTLNKPFGDFWAVYPNKRGKANAEKRWLKMSEDDQVKAINDVINRKKKDDQWIKDNGRYIPHASTYLNAQQWQDEWQDDGGKDKFASMFGSSTKGGLR